MTETLSDVRSTCETVNRPELGLKLETMEMRLWSCKGATLYTFINVLNIFKQTLCSSPLI